MLSLFAPLLYLLSLLLLHSTSNDVSNDGDGDEEEETEEQSDEEAEADIELMKNPRAKIRAMQDHINRLHRRLDDGQAPKIAVLEKRIAERDERIKELEEGGGKSGALAASLQDARLRTAFLQHVLEYPDKIDVDTAWDLGNVRGFFDAVTVDDESGEAVGMDKAMASMLERYPWIADGFEDEDDSEDDTSELPPRPRTGTGRRAKAPSNGAMQSAALKERFPALKNRKK